MTRAATTPNWWLFVRFEQGRGRGGVPKTFIPYMPEGAVAPTIETLTRMAVQMMRAQCADPSMHGRDLMPGRDEEYHLHNIDGGLLERAAAYLAEDHRSEWAQAAAFHGGGVDPDAIHDAVYLGPRTLPNVWLGTSIENDRHVFRADVLREVPAAVRFISAEPLLGPLPSLSLNGIDWLIVGGESGHGFRPMRAEWAKPLRDAAVGHGTAFFFKQWGGRTPKAGGRLLDGRLWDEMPKQRGTTEAGNRPTPGSSPVLPGGGTHP